MGRFPGNVEVNDDMLTAGEQHVKLVSERIPENLPWKDLGIDILVEINWYFSTKRTTSKTLRCRLF